MKIEKKLYRLGLFTVNNILYEKNEFTLDTAVLNKKSLYLDGYWQTYKYFENIREILLEEFSLKEELNLENRNILNKIKSRNSISLHIRRGDYITNSHTSNVHGACSIHYYMEAIEYINRRIDSPVYFIFSDDIQWVKENLEFNNEKVYVDINDGETAYCDLELMKNCQHNIIANSTFSWWGAWLNINKEKIVITPKKWMNIKRDFSGLIPIGWIKI